MRLLLVALLASGLPGEERDAVVEAARRALDAGQPVAALQVLNGHPAESTAGIIRLLQARALLALGRPQEVVTRLGLREVEALSAWPEPLRGSACMLVGEAALGVGDLASARPWLERAVRLRGAGVALDQTLVLLAECCERQGDVATALRYAHAVWRDWPRSPYRGRAGVIEARLIASTQPDEARAVLAGVRVLDQSGPATRLAAAELLCHLLLRTRPGQCLVVAEQDMGRLSVSGRLPLYRALALAALDPRDGLAALQMLPAPLRADPSVAAAIERLSGLSAVLPEDVTLRIERARAEIELGRIEVARGMLEPLAATHPAALILLGSLDGTALERWLETPAMREPAAQAALGIAFARRGEHARAWSLLHPLVAPVVREVTGVSSASLLYWSAAAARVVAPEHVAVLTNALLGLDTHTVESGMAWALEAQRREKSAVASEAVRTAWERAGEDLPGDHPWQPIAILRATRPLLEAPDGLERARGLLERIDGHASEDQRRCRFLLAQVYERLGRRDQALEVVDELRSQADAKQGEKLERLRARLATNGTSEVQPGPLDAEN